jgi:hypothetical protein
MEGAAGAADGTAAWARLAEPSAAPLLDALRGIDAAPAAGVIERLRKAFPADTVTAAIELSIARTRAHDKFGERADTLWCDRPGVEMASSPATAAWKAARFREAGAARIDDLCCGIGGDLMELARVADAVGVDMQPLRAWMAARNASCTVRCADSVAEPGDAPFAHADPARRAGGGRIHRAEDLLPSLESLRASMRGRAGGAIKLGPGMDLGWGEVDADDEVEFIGEHGRLVQQVLWSGALVRRPGARTATKACTGRTVSGTPDDAPAGDGRMLRTLLVPDPALERARLLGEFTETLGALDAAPGLGILTRDDASPIPTDCAEWFEQFEVLEELPAREQSVAAWLAARGAGIVTVRTRGGACDPDAWQRALRGPGREPWTVFVLRLGERRAAYAVRRVRSS